MFAKDSIFLLRQVQVDGGMLRIGRDVGLLGIRDGQSHVLSRTEMLFTSGGWLEWGV